MTINSISNVSGYFVSLVITFFLTPFIVRTLGDSLYGFWVLLMSFIGYASILEMGVQPAVVKLVGQYKAVENVEKLQELLSAAFLFFLAAGLVSAAVLVVALPPYVSHFVSDLAEIHHTRTVFGLIAADALVMFSNYLFSAILYGWQLYYAKNLIDIAAWIANAGLLLLLLERGQMLALASVKLCVDLVTLGGLIFMCRRVFPEMRLRARGVSRHSFRELLSFGSRIFVSATTTRIANYAQPVIISTALSSAATAFFAIPSRLVDYGRQMTWGLTTAFMPMFSELQSRQERDLLVSLYLRYSRYVFLLILPMVVVLAVFGPPFIGLWIGPEYAERGRAVLLLLAGSVLVEGFQPLLWRFFIGVGNLGVLVRVSAISSGLVVLGGIALVRPLGIAGVAASVLVGAAIAQVLFLRHACRYLGIPLFRFMAQVHLRPLLVGFLVLMAAWQGAARIHVSSYLQLVLGTSATLALHVVLSAVLALGSEERRWVLRRLRPRRA